jgi:hypothetical protein
LLAEGNGKHNDDAELQNKHGQRPLNQRVLNQKPPLACVLC